MFLINKIFNKIKKNLFKRVISAIIFLGILINPFFIIRRNLMSSIKSIAPDFNNGLLLDIGCGSKPYKCFFNVEKYIGIDLLESGHNHSTSK